MLLILWTRGKRRRESHRGGGRRRITVVGRHIFRYRRRRRDNVLIRSASYRVIPIPHHTASGRSRSGTNHRERRRRRQQRSVRSRWFLRDTIIGIVLSQTFLLFVFVVFVVVQMCHSFHLTVVVHFFSAPSGWNSHSKQRSSIRQFFDDVALLEVVHVAAAAEVMVAGGALCTRSLFERR